MKAVNLDILIQGAEHPIKLAKLIKISGKTSEKVKKAVTAHLVDGMAKKMVHMTFDISQQQLDKALADLNELKLDIIEYNDI